MERKKKVVKLKSAQTTKELFEVKPEAKAKRTAISKMGAKCDNCGVGKYRPTGKRGVIENPKTGETQEYIELECDQCGNKHHQLNFGEKVKISESVKVKKIS
jgi:Zn finger protein HypA/HybF involved in hydrogenase expression